MHPLHLHPLHRLQQHPLHRPHLWHLLRQPRALPPLRPSHLKSPHL
jgi:hypothetical protein